MISSLLGFSGCGGSTPIDPPALPDRAAIDLHFELRNGEEGIEYQSAFTDEEGFQHALLTLKLYLSRIELLNADGSTLTLDDVVLFDYKPQDSFNNTPQWSRSVRFEVPTGTYTGIRFGVGVPADLNDEDPTTYANEHPLSTFSGMYWNWATMYRFIILEAESDTGSGSLDHDLLFHTGLDDLYRESEIYPITLSLEPGDLATLHLELDWNAIWYPENSEIDIKKYHSTHTTDSPEDLDLAIRFTENFVAGISIKQEE